MLGLQARIELPRDAEVVADGSRCRFDQLCNLTPAEATTVHQYPLGVRCLAAYVASHATILPRAKTVRWKSLVRGVAGQHSVPADPAPAATRDHPRHPPPQ